MCVESLWTHLAGFSVCFVCVDPLGRLQRLFYGIMVEQQQLVVMVVVSAVVVGVVVWRLLPSTPRLEARARDSDGSSDYDVSKVEEYQQLALLRLYIATDGPNWERRDSDGTGSVPVSGWGRGSDSWLSGSWPVCTWSGITCGTYDVGSKAQRHQLVK